MWRQLSLILFLVLAAQAKDLHSWDNLTVLKQGDNIEVSRKAGPEVRGQFITSSDEVITVRTKQGEVNIARPDVVAVGTKHARSKTARIIGTSVGALGGVVAGSLLGTRLANEGQGDKAAVSAAGAGIGAALGLAIGWGQDGGDKPIYRGR